MKPALALLSYLALIFCATAVLSPIIYWMLAGFVHWPFHRCVDRMLMVSAMGWMVVFWRSFGLTSWQELNISWRRIAQGILWGGVAGLLVAGIVLAFTLAFHARVWMGLMEPLHLPLIFLGLLVLACIEEGLFRGVAQSVFIRQFGVVGGISLTTLLFAVMHFVKVPSNFPADTVHWYSGWMAVGLSFSALWGAGWLGGYLVVLILLGGVLSLCVLIFRSLGPAIGVHAGLIIGQRLIEAGSVPGKVVGPLAQPLNSNPITEALLVVIFILLLFRYFQVGKTMIS